MGFRFRLVLKFHQLTILLLLLTYTNPALCYYTSIFSFGDSLTDTGNSVHLEADNPSYSSRFPYGMTYFHHPTGRYSDGRLVVDFIAQYLGLPLLPPYLSGGNVQDFRHGVNFAVGGATALDAALCRQRGIHNDYKNSLGVQLGWFRKLLPSLCDSLSNCRDLFSKSLFLVGEIGGNDYNYPLLERRSLEEIRSIVPEVVNTISSAIQMLIEHGAITLLVPGNLPVGCLTIYLVVFESQNKGDYDSQTGCLKWLNELAQYHNHLLQEELNHLRKLHPHVSIIYADYYNAAMSFYRSPDEFGFSKGSLAACCGGEGPYNFNLSALCGYYGAKVCEDPELYTNWDGIHLTEAAYKTIATTLLEGPYAIPPLNISHLSLVQNVEILKKYS